jgi:glucose-1-phosphatase
MPSAYLFDIGNVILRFDFLKAARKLAPHTSVTAEELLARVAPLTVSLELGRLSAEAFIEAASEETGYTGSPASFRTAFEDIFELNEPMVAFIEDLKRERIPLYLLSNTNGIHVPFFEATYPVFNLFDGRIYSHEVGFMKPDPSIYEVVKTTLPLVAERTVYIDDVVSNCAAGREAGFIAVAYSAEGHADFLKTIATLA